MNNTKNSMNNLNIFLDESGKKKNEISLIGAISIPDCYYNLDPIKNLNNQLRRKEIKLHFTHYSPNNFELYKKVFKTFLSSSHMIDVNIISYKISNFRNHPLLSHQIRNMIYEKVPERVIYGLLRNQSKLRPTTANIFVENSTEYQHRDLDKKNKTTNKCTRIISF